MMSESDLKIKPQLTGRIFLKATLINTSPLALSNGQAVFSDADIFRDHEGKPMIPGTSFMGALKSYLEQYSELKENKVWNYLFGEAENFQSHLIFDDLKCTSEEINTSIRDGVKIDSKTNLAEDQGKYDYELLEPEHSFELAGEITLREAIESLQSEIGTLLGAISHVLSEGKMQVGSLTSFGFGQLQGQINKTELLQGNDYFDFLENGSSYSDIKGDDNGIQDISCLSIDMSLKPTTPFFIGGGAPQTDADDASLRSNGQYVVTAKSLKGAVRHHAYRIANTVHGETKAEDLCNAVFGHRGEGKLTKSKFWTTDAILKNTGDAKAQMQVKIDRFTGGAIDSALFSTEPVWPKDDTYVKVEWKLVAMDEKYKNAAIGLLLLVARDLMTELLPVGGNKAIGRGRFENEECYIQIAQEKFKLEGNKLKEGKEADLNSYVSAFLNYKNETSE